MSLGCCTRVGAILHVAGKCSSVMSMFLSSERQLEGASASTQANLAFSRRLCLGSGELLPEKLRQRRGQAPCYAWRFNAHALLAAGLVQGCGRGYDVVEMAKLGKRVVRLFFADFEPAAAPAEFVAPFQRNEAA